MPVKLGTPEEERRAEVKLLGGIIGGQGLIPKEPTRSTVKSDLEQREAPLKGAPQARGMFRGPGMSGLLADLAQVFSARDPKSWQHQLGGMVATKATADVFSKYTKNLEDIISGESEAGTAMEGLTPLEQQRIAPEARAMSLEAIVAGEKMKQAERRVGVEEERAEALKGYYEDIGSYYEYLQTKPVEERDRFVTTEVGAPGGMKQKMVYNLDTKESALIGDPYEFGAQPREDMPVGQKANLIRGLERDAALEAGRMLEMQGVGKVVMAPDGSVTFRFADPKMDPVTFENAKKRALFRSVTQQLKAGTIDEATANAILGIEEPAITPGEAREWKPDKQYEPGEYLLIGGVLHQTSPDGKGADPVQQGGK